MIYFFKKSVDNYIVVESTHSLSDDNIRTLQWLLGNAQHYDFTQVEGEFISTHKALISPWGSNAVEITHNIGITSITRIEEFFASHTIKEFDPLLQERYSNIKQDVFTLQRQRESMQNITNIQAYNSQEDLALTTEEIEYLEQLSQRLERPLTDSEVFGFSQVNSEHCRHKIFNGLFIIDGKEKDYSLFKLIKQTTEENTNRVVSAYKDNCAFMQGPTIKMFVPRSHNKPDFYTLKQSDTVISLKAETHNYPTTVEPYNGAATGAGGEIRDRMGGGRAAFALAGAAVYMTSYPRLQNAEHSWELTINPRPWLYQTPEAIIKKASAGASDNGNITGQPLINGSFFTFEHKENGKTYGYDKVIMQAGGVGFTKKENSIKGEPQAGDKVVLLGGDNFRIGLGGGAVSSVNTAGFDSATVQNAVQRSNPELQRRVYNTVRAMGEMDTNPIVSIHDHGAGGHLNCLSELIENTGGVINLDKLPIGDPSLSAKELTGNESQERMGLVIKEKDISILQEVAERERAPLYVIGEADNSHNLTFTNQITQETPINMQLNDMFGSSPKTIMNDVSVAETFADAEFTADNIYHYIEQVLQLESVGSKDFLTNKVDRSATGLVSTQQTCGELQLPLNNFGVIALDFVSNKGIATAIGHAPVAALISAGKGSVLAIAEALTNIVFAPIQEGIKGISLSANWMWPCRNKGEDARLYEAVQAASDFAKSLHINIPTGKDSLSMTQKYPNGEAVLSPGTVIITSIGEVTDIRKTVEPVTKQVSNSKIIYIDLGKSGFPLGGSALFQTLNAVGQQAPTVSDAAYFAKTFDAVQACIQHNYIYAGHDISSGGMITSLLEMNFANTHSGMKIDITAIEHANEIEVLFSENPGLILQISQSGIEYLASQGVQTIEIGQVTNTPRLEITTHQSNLEFDIQHLRNVWMKTSYEFDAMQTNEGFALKRYKNVATQALSFSFPSEFKGTHTDYTKYHARTESTGVRAAIIREKGSNGEREVAWNLYAAGFDVKDVHMTDLISGKETLEDISFIVFVDGATNSHVFGPAKGWAATFLHNPSAKKALDAFYARTDTLSLGIANGCQLMVELGLLDSSSEPVTLQVNESGKFESAFVGVHINESSSILCKSLNNNTLGTWVAHCEGRFSIPENSNSQVIASFAYQDYPANPNGSDQHAAGICSADGRHTAIMFHAERSLYPWNWAYYPESRKNDEITPWIDLFINARLWIEQNKK